MAELCNDDSTMNDAGTNIVNHVMSCLDTGRLDLPPGGGLQSK